MLNNRNYYHIKLEFASFLRGFPEFIIHQQQDGYVNVTIPSFHAQSCFVSFPQANLLQYYTPQSLIEQVFHELEKDYIEDDELRDLGKLVKNYLLLLKQIQTDQAYYTITPGLMAGFFIAIHTCLLLFPANRALIFASLAADFYGLSFWLFLVWSSSKNQHALHRLETQLTEKINFLKSLYPLSQIDEFSLTSSLSSTSSLLPSYEEVLLEDAMRYSEESRPIMTTGNTAHFFYCSGFNNESPDNNENEADPSTERCYSVRIS